MSELSFEHLRQWGFAPGVYSCFCSECGKQHTSDKRAWRCLQCAEKRAGEQTDQRAMVAAVLERAARISEDRNDAIWDLDDGVQCGLDGAAEAIRALIDTDHAAALDALVQERVGTLIAAEHPDDKAVNRFSVAMKQKLKWEREVRGRGGWDDPELCGGDYLAKLLVEHLAKGNAGTFEDVANFAMMMHQRGLNPSELAAALDALVQERAGTLIAEIEMHGYQRGQEDERRKLEHHIHRLSGLGEEMSGWANVHGGHQAIVNWDRANADALAAIRERGWQER